MFFLHAVLCVLISWPWLRGRFMLCANALRWALPHEINICMLAAAVNAAQGAAGDHGRGLRPPVQEQARPQGARLQICLVPVY